MIVWFIIYKYVWIFTWTDSSGSDSDSCFDIGFIKQEIKWRRRIGMLSRNS